MQSHKIYTVVYISPIIYIMTGFVSYLLTLAQILLKNCHIFNCKVLPRFLLIFAVTYQRLNDEMSPSYVWNLILLTFFFHAFNA